MAEWLAAFSDMSGFMNKKSRIEGIEAYRNYHRENFPFEIQDIVWVDASYTKVNRGY